MKTLKELLDRKEKRKKEGYFFINPFLSERKIVNENGETLIRIREIDQSQKKEVCCYFNSEGKLSRTNGPAFNSFELIQKEDGKIVKNPIRKIYYLNGVCHKENGPAFIEYYENGTVSEERYYVYGKLHREDGPAIIQYYPSGKPRLMVWYKNGTVHRENDPAYVEFTEDGKIAEERYYVNGKLHRNDYPAVIIYDTIAGNKMALLYYNDGILTKKIIKTFDNAYRFVNYDLKKTGFARETEPLNIEIIHEISFS